MIEIVPCNGWLNCIRLSNGKIELIATLEVGPRVIRFGFVDGDNLFNEVESDMGQLGGDQFRFYGGHRLWHAPESHPRTYLPDNQPIAYESLADGMRLIQPVETATGIQKEIEFHLSPNANRVEVHHRLRNAGQWAVQLAPWALSAMAAGGTALIPLSPKGDHASNLQPVNSLALWAYTDLSDPRWTFGGEYIALRQDVTRPAPQKLGLLLSEGWLAYARRGDLFIKRAVSDANATYPDRGSSAEVFTNHEMLELETLGPMKLLEPGSVVEHSEIWELHQGADFSSDTEISKLWGSVKAVVSKA
jgi:hypothetical protein